MGTTFNVTTETRVAITVNDPDVIRRCVENTPSENGYGENYGWRETFYDLRTAEQVLHHLAFNCIANGIERVNRLDGWADLADDAATMTVVRDVDVLQIVEAVDA